MPQSCCVPKCRSISKRGCGISFFTFPTNSIIRARWISAIQASSNPKIRVCSKHFNPGDYVFGGNKRKLKKKAVPSMYLPKPFKVLSNSVANATSSAMISNLLQEQNTKNTIIFDEKETNKELFSLNELFLPKPLFTLNPFITDEKIHFYTGFQKFSTLKTVFKFILPTGNLNDLMLFNSTYKQTKILRSISRSIMVSPEQQFFLTLIRLKRGLPFDALRDLFDISSETAGKLFMAWVNVLYLRLGSLNNWDQKNKLIKEEQRSFRNIVEEKEINPNLIGSIDCTEFCQYNEPSSLVRPEPPTQGKGITRDVYYMGHSTVKSLIMVNPNGFITYSSPLYSCPISDKGIVKKSGLIDILKEKVESGNINAGDIILADKGFDVGELFSNVHLKLNIPVDRISGTQFTREAVEITRKLIQERIHVEKAIGRLKSYKILSTIPIAGLGEHIYHVCCWLSNFR